MTDGPFSTNEVLAFFEESAGVRFFDAETGQPVLQRKASALPQRFPSGGDDYDKWLNEQGSISHK
jgi:hypothetical protein